MSDKYFKISLLITFLVFAGFLFNVIAKACECTPQKSATENLANAAAVFSGKVVDITYRDAPEQTDPEPRITVRFQVYESWKGVDSDRFKINTVMNHSTCSGYEFKEGKEYLVFSFARDYDPNKDGMLKYVPEKIYDVSLCDGTTPLSSANKYLKELGQGKKFN